MSYDCYMRIDTGSLDGLATVEGNREAETLVELSHKCAVDAVVEALRLGEARHSQR